MIERVVFIPHLNHPCLCHARYHVLKSSIEGTHAAYLTLPAEVQRKNYTMWASGRIKALLGIVRTPSSPCIEKCACHGEYAVLKRRLESDEKSTVHLLRANRKEN